ncbi:MAG: sigma-70 family RNA polymerase sigma factor [Candidatus Paceibacterota bacterium]
MNKLSDEQLVGKYLRGEKKALEILISRYLKPIYNFAYSFCGDAEAAEDITQEAFVKVWRNIKRFDQNKKFKTWIFEIAKNTSIDFNRKKKTIPFSRFENEGEGNKFIENLIDFSPLPLEIFELKEWKNKISGAIGKLSEKYQKIVALRYENQMTFREISELTGESINTVKSRYRRGLTQLKKSLS